MGLYTSAIMEFCNNYLSLMSSIACIFTFKQSHISISNTFRIKLSISCCQTMEKMLLCNKYWHIYWQINTIIFIPKKMIQITKQNRSTGQKDWNWFEFLTLTHWQTNSNWAVFFNMKSVQIKSVRSTYNGQWLIHSLHLTDQIISCLHPSHPFLYTFSPCKWNGLLVDIN